LAFVHCWMCFFFLSKGFQHLSLYLSHSFMLPTSIFIFPPSWVPSLFNCCCFCFLANQVWQSLSIIWQRILFLGVGWGAHNFVFEKASHPRVKLSSLKQAKAQADLFFPLNPMIPSLVFPSTGYHRNFSMPKP
jgi:hypothetical protein